MGILDNDFARLVFSGSPYMQAREKQRRQDELSGRVQGLLGSPYQPGADDGLGLAGLGQAEQMGTGLLGNQITQPQFAAELMGIPGYQNAGTSLMMNQNNNAGAMQRQQQGQDYAENNMNLYQKTSLGLEQTKNRLQQGMNMLKQQLGLDKNRNDLIQGVGDKIYKTAERYMPVIEAEGNVNNILQQSVDPQTGLLDYEKVNGAQIQQIQSSFLSTIRPGEAQMEGDIKQLADAMGFRGAAENAWQWLTSNTATKPEHAMMMHQLIQKQSALAQKRITNVVDRAEAAYSMDKGERDRATYRLPAYTPQQFQQSGAESEYTPTPGRRPYNP